MLNQPLTDLQYLKQVLAKLGATPKRSMGQNFLICPEVVDATMAVLAGGPKHITELGAGVGTLTQAVLAANLTIRAIEKDDTLVRILRAHAVDADVIHGDVREVPWEWEEPYQVIGNIPYNISGLIIRRLTTLDPAPVQALLLMQAEVAHRLLAHPPNMSLLSLAVQLWGQAHHTLTVPPSCFWPQPKVTSVLLALTPADTIPKHEREAILALAKHCFQGKRKQIGGSLKRAGVYGAAHIDAALAKASIAASARPQELPAASWQILYRELTHHA